ncbi:MAG: radical SAM protein [Acidobacteria bacterium]|nr:radical SAM protein [Acidobacteriota bacterium]
MPPLLPPSLCFRVTRACNARCGFCLAPPDGVHPSGEVLRHRLDWLRARGVRSFDFCGGEPTLHPALPELLRHLHAGGGRGQVTTNGLALSDALLQALKATGGTVKVSLHGDRAHHDALVGCEAFEATTATVRRLVEAGVPTALQTTVVAGGGEAVGWVVAFCLQHHVRRLNLLPFIPRGRGRDRREDYGLEPFARRALRDEVKALRRAHLGHLDLRWLDFSLRPVPVVEPDGRVVWEGATERVDREICRIEEMIPTHL